MTETIIYKSKGNLLDRVTIDEENLKEGDNMILMEILSKLPKDFILPKDIKLIAGKLSDDYYLQPSRKTSDKDYIEKIKGVLFNYSNENYEIKFEKKMNIKINGLDEDLLIFEFYHDFNGGD